MSVLALKDGPCADAELIGGKARGLADLFRIGLPVPPAVVLTTEAHARFRSDGKMAEADRAALAEAVEQIGPPLAVRSSAADEDAAERSAAGQYDSVMGLESLDAVLGAVEHCWREGERGRALAYRDGTPASIALVIQQEVAADRAGVAFSADPVTGSDTAVLVEAVFGHGHGVVSGAVTPDRYRVNRGSNAVAARVADKQAAANAAEALHPLAPERRTARVLRDDEARAVAGLVAAAEDGVGTPVDIEFCFAHGELWALQCRPITTLR